MKIYKKRPNLLRNEIDVQGVKIIQIFDGEKAWVINPLGGITDFQELTGDQANMIAQQAIFDDALIDYRDKGHEITYAGKKTYNYKEYECLKLTMYKGEENESSQIFYFDPVLCLPVKIEYITGNENKAEVILSDYREAGDGILMPFKIENSYNGQIVQTVGIDSIILNGSIDDSLFDHTNNTVE